MDKTNSTTASGSPESQAPSAFLDALKTVTGPMQIDFNGGLSVRVDLPDAMAARILEFTAIQWPQAQIGQIMAALQEALWWQKFIVAVVDGKETPPDVKP